MKNLSFVIIVLGMRIVGFSQVPGFLAIKKNQTGTGTTEIHAVSGQNLNTFEFQIPTGLPATDGNYQFDFADWNNDGVKDFCIIAKSGTGTHSTELHVLSGKDFKTPILHTGTPLEETNDTFDIHIGDWNRDGQQDLIAVKKSGTGTHSTELHVYSGKDFNVPLVHSPTGLGETGSNFEFDIQDWNNDGQLDLIAINKAGTGTKTTELHIFSGNNLNTPILQTGTGLHETDNTFTLSVKDWNGDGQKDLVAIKKSGTGTNKTELHVFSGKDLKIPLVHSSTVLHETGANFAFITFGVPPQSSVSQNEQKNISKSFWDSISKPVGDAAKAVALEAGRAFLCWIGICI